MSGNPSLAISFHSGGFNKFYVDILIDEMFQTCYAKFVHTLYGISCGCSVEAHCMRGVGGFKHG